MVRMGEKATYSGDVHDGRVSRLHHGCFLRWDDLFSPDIVWISNAIII